MKKTITLLSSALLSVCMFSQPVLTYDGSHGIGTQCNMYVIGGSVTSLQQTGPGLTWNLSSNSLNQVGTFNLVDPSGTPGGSSYPTANLSFQQTVTGQGTTYTYLVDSPTELNSIADNIGGSNPTIWTQYDKLFEYPFNYLDSFACTRQAAGSSPEPFVRKYDAYGTITINGKTYNNVVRVTKTPGNSIWLNTSPIFPIILQANSTTYLYNEPSTLSGINSPLSAAAVSVFPNPAHGKFILSVSSTRIGEENLFILTNALGKSVKQISIKELMTECNISDLPAGIYFYQVNGENGIMAKGKVVVE
jgi:hypothetical protein